MAGVVVAGVVVAGVVVAGVVVAGVVEAGVVSEGVVGAVAVGVAVVSSEPPRERATRKPAPTTTTMAITAPTTSSWRCASSSGGSRRGRGDVVLPGDLLGLHRILERGREPVVLLWENRFAGTAVGAVAHVPEVTRPAGGCHRLRCRACHTGAMTWALVIGVVIVVLLLAGIYLYNRIVRLRNEVDTGWSNIDVQLKRRNDLIPNLVEAVKGYAAHERDVFEEVTRARAAMAQASTPAEAGAADSFLGQALGRLFAVAEAYPDLKASTNFLQLQSDLTDTEDKIAAARRYYNSTVQAFNTAIQTFPSLLFAGAAGFRAREFFAAEADDRAPVAVSFPS